MENNSRTDIEIRRSRGVLYHIGRGVILFGLWTVVKAVSMNLLEYSAAVGSAEEIASASGDVSPEHQLYAALIITAIALAARLYVGRTAVAVSKGEKRGSLYIFLTLIMAVVSFLVIALAIAAIVYIFKTDPGILKGRSGILSAIIIEITSMIMLIELVAASLRLRKLEKRGAS